MRTKQVATWMAATVLGLCLAASPAWARGGFHGGGFRGSIGGAVIVRPFGFYGYYDPWFWGPFAYPTPYWGYAVPAHPGMGQVKIQTHLKDAEVWIDGAYAGTTKQTKDMWLKSGSHDIEIRAANNLRYAEHVYVLTGKTLKISPGF